MYCVRQQVSIFHFCFVKDGGPPDTGVCLGVHLAARTDFLLHPLHTGLISRSRTECKEIVVKMGIEPTEENIFFPLVLQCLPQKHQCHKQQVQGVNTWKHNVFLHTILFHHNDITICDQKKLPESFYNIVNIHAVVHYM